MSTADQPLLIANSNYHVGHQVAFFVAEEQGFFREEGLTRYDYDGRGLIPGPLESQGLALAMWEHGVDIVTAVDVGATIHQRAQGADLYIVGGWRYTPDLKWYGAKDIADIPRLRGRKIGIREKEGLVQIFMADALRQAGIDPDRDVEWVLDPVFGYGNDPAHVDMLRSGRVDAMYSFPPFAQVLEREGYPVLLDPAKVFPRRPGKVTVAPMKTIEDRGDELRAYLRAIIRAFWFMRDVSHFDYLRDLERRLRQTSHNEEERQLFIVTSLEKVEGWALPIDGGVLRAGLQRVIDELRARGPLDTALTVEEVLRDGPVRDAFAALRGRPDLQNAFDIAERAAAKYGF